MNRRTIFAGLAAAVGLKAQHSTFKGEDCPSCVPPLPALGRPNTCPVCGERAEVYRRPTVEQYVNFRPSGDGISAYFDTEQVPYGPMERITRCKRCNAAFWQDAEGE